MTDFDLAPDVALKALLAQSEGVTDEGPVSKHGDELRMAYTGSRWVPGHAFGRPDPRPIRLVNLPHVFEHAEAIRLVPMTGGGHEMHVTITPAADPEEHGRHYLFRLREGFEAAGDIATVTATVPVSAADDRDAVVAGLTAATVTQRAPVPGDDLISPEELGGRRPPSTLADLGRRVTSGRSGPSSSRTEVLQRVGQPVNGRTLPEGQRAAEAVAKQVAELPIVRYAQARAVELDRLVTDQRGTLQGSLVRQLAAAVYDYTEACVMHGRQVERFAFTGQHNDGQTIRHYRRRETIALARLTALVSVFAYREDYDPTWEIAAW